MGARGGDTVLQVSPSLAHFAHIHILRRNAAVQSLQGDFHLWCTRQHAKAQIRRLTSPTIVEPDFVWHQSLHGLPDEPTVTVGGGGEHFVRYRHGEGHHTFVNSGVAYLQVGRGPLPSPQIRSRMSQLSQSGVGVNTSSGTDMVKVITRLSTVGSRTSRWAEAPCRAHRSPNRDAPGLTVANRWPRGVRMLPDTLKSRPRAWMRCSVRPKRRSKSGWMAVPRSEE